MLKNDVYDNIDDVQKKFNKYCKKLNKIIDKFGIITYLNIKPTN